MEKVAATRLPYAAGDASGELIVVMKQALGGNVRVSARFVMCAITFVSVQGCAGYEYIGPRDGQPEATLEFRYVGHGGQVFNTFDDENCTPPGSVLASVHTLTKPAKLAAVHANKPILINAKYAKLSAGATKIYTESCNNTIVFVPKDGHSYLVQQSANGGQCSIAISDKDGSSEAPKLEPRELRGICSAPML